VVRSRQGLTDSSSPYNPQVAIEIKPKDKVLGLEQPNPCPWCCLGQHIKMDQAKVADESEDHKDGRLNLGLVGVLMVDGNVPCCKDKVPVICRYAM
jgi:hypothetical protein